MTRGLFGRLLAMMCGVAATSTGAALLLQERSLSGDLQRAAEERLENAASAAGRLLEGHLDAMAERYRAVSGTPQFRATLEVDDGPTLAHYAETLLGQQDAARIAFVDAGGAVVAAAGADALDPRALAVRDTGVVAHAGGTFAVVSVPIAGAGRLVAAEPIAATTLALWSELCGARVAFAPPGGGTPEGLRKVVREAGGLELRVSSGLGAERQAMATARWNLAAAGALGLALALLVSLGASRGLVRPIQEVQEAARRIGAGDLTQHVATGRRDEIGDVARAFEDMSTRLRATIEQVVEAADRVDATASTVAEGATRFTRVTRTQREGHDEAATTLAEIEERVARVAGTAGDSADGIDRTVEESTEAFRELAGSGRALEDASTRLGEQTEEIGQAIERLAASAVQMAGDAESLLPAVETTATSLDEMAAAASSVNEHASETKQLADGVVDTAEDGRRVVREAVAGMEATLETVGDSERVIESLRGRAEEIGSILSVIGDVTDETGLLALNAAIIAAQAGEHGKSFGVVAGQMKALAERVRASTREIEDVVRAVQDESRAAVTSIAAGSARAREGAERIARAEAALADITRAARETGTRMGESANATAEQMMAAGSVAKQMETVREGMARIREAAREQADANASLQRGTESLRGVARDVRGAVETQSRGASRIGKAVEAVKRAVGEVAGALEAQGAASRQVAAVIRRATELGSSHETSAEEMGEAARQLGHQAEEMRAAVGRFRIASPARRAPDAPETPGDHG